MKRLPLIFLLNLACFAAIPTNGNTVWEVRTVGSDTNGGGFVTGSSGSDMSQNNNKNATSCTNCFSSTANLSTTDAVTAGTTTVTSATAAFSSAIVGNIIYLAGGTGSVAANWYEVTAFTNSTTITVDRSTGLTAGTGVTMNIGGAMATPGAVSGIFNTNSLGSQTVYFKAGTYVQTTASAHVSGGEWQNGNNAYINVIGYNANRTDFTAAPSWQTQSGVTSATIADLRGVTVYNLTLDCNSQTGSIGISNVIFATTGYGVTLKNCKTATSLSAAAGFSYSVFTGNGNGGSAQGLSGTVDCFYCYFSGNSTPGFQGNSCSYCISVNNTNATWGIGFYLTIAGGVCDHCVAYGNAAAGIQLNTSGLNIVSNSIAESNTGFGINISAGVSSNSAILFNDGVYNNTGGNTNLTNLTLSSNITTGTGSFFVNASGGNFALNNNSGAGAALRNAGFPGAWPGGISSTTYQSVGAIQIQATSGGISASVH